MRNMSKVYCNKTDCPSLNCSHHIKHVRSKSAKTAPLEGTILCIKPLNKSKGAGKLPVPTESQEQQALFEWAERLYKRYPELAVMYHIPNEGKRSKATGARLLKEGMKPGVPDIHLPVARGGFHSLYIELKRRNGSSTTDAQNTWLQMLGKYGNKAVRCYGWEEAAKVIVEYLELSSQ